MEFEEFVQTYYHHEEEHLPTWRSQVGYGHLITYCHEHSYKRNPFTLCSLVFVVWALMNILSSGLFENGETNVLETLISMEL